MAYQEILLLVGRVMLGGFFLMNAYNHFAKAKMLTQYAQSKKVPMAGEAVILTGLLLLLGGLGLVFGVFVKIALFLLILFLVPVSIQMHAFWEMEGDEKMSEMVNFMKNMALVGALLMMYSITVPWPVSIGS